MPRAQGSRWGALVWTQKERQVPRRMGTWAKCRLGAQFVGKGLHAIAATHTEERWAGKRVPAEKDGKTSEKCQKAWARKGLAMSLMWGWQTVFILKSCPALTSPLPSFLQPRHWAQLGQGEGLPHRVGVPSVPPRCSWARHCPGPAWPPCPIRRPPALTAPIYSVGMS